MNTYDFERFSIRDKCSRDKCLRDKCLRDKCSRDKCSELYSTPQNIAFDMFSLLFQTDFFNEPNESITMEDYIRTHRIIDIYCKSGSILLACHDGFMFALRNVIPDRDDRDYFIVKYLLFGLCPDDRYLSPLRDIFYCNKKYDLSRGLGNFYHYDLSTDTGSDKLKVEELLKSMEFDVVVGNPPYNNDAYIDFVLKGHELAKSYDLWITPAKFINKQSDNDNKMRADIVPYISNFIYYPEHRDVFNIMLRGGLGIYLVKKTITEYTVVENKSKDCKLFNGVANRDLGSILLNIGYSLDKRINSNTSLLSDRLNLNKRYYLNEYETGHGIEDNNDVAIVQGGKGIIGYIDKSDLKTDCNIDKYKIVFPSMCGAAEIDSSGKILGLNEVYILEPYEVSKGGYPTACFFDTRYEAENFRKFMFTKFFRFLYYIKVTSSNINATFFSSIPDPGSFDRIFEDKPLMGYTPDENGEYVDADGNKHCSLYVKYKLTDEEINIIESVIRERK